MGVSVPNTILGVQASCCLRQTSIRRRRRRVQAGEISTRALRVYHRRVLALRSCRFLDSQPGESCRLASGSSVRWYCIRCISFVAEYCPRA